MKKSVQRTSLMLFMLFVSVLISDSLKASPSTPLPYPKIDLLSFEAYESLPTLSPERMIPLDNEWSKGQPLLGGFRNLYNAQIFHEPGSDYPFRLYFFGWSVQVCNHHLSVQSGCDAIFYGRSKNMKTWEIFTGFDFTGAPKFDSKGKAHLWQPIIEAGNTYWDQWHNGDPSVIKVGNVYFMALSVTGFDVDGIPDGKAWDKDKDFSAIGGAYSTDGIRWTKLSLPLLVARSEPGGKGPADFGNYHRPSLMYENGRFKMWFDYWHPTAGLSMGYAELEGPATLETFKRASWIIRQGHDRPAIQNWPNPTVIKVPNGYLSYADPVGYGEGWPGRKIAEAFSSDGIQWEIRGYLEPHEGCPANGVPEALVLGSEIYLTSGCQRGGHPYSPDYPAIHIRKRALAK